MPSSTSPTGETIYGRIARGPRRELISKEGWESARSWGLNTVVDLRCLHETGAREQDPEVDERSTENIVVLSTPTEDQESEEFRRTCFPILDSPEYWVHNWRILPELVRNSLRAIATSPSGVLVHCSAGRDRTGMITALLLGNAGVPPSSVVDDYAQSVRAMAGTPHQGQAGDRQAEWNSQQREDWIESVSPIVYEAAEDTQRAFDMIQLDRRDQRRLREMLTQPSVIFSAHKC
ncbi:tyrosine-protein phosphatase [Paramicrobacterium fandaimingii]|uniref:tyrosine-protein phosphatase n=1 Tax=Paramicrobacterium fandaimingii TaxID=2708079 RepID=UPI001C3FB85A|nr:tyrosine-protein phosphatase [Microbacterium fandaimingii]